MIKKSGILILVVLFALSSCAKLDVVATDSVRAFGEMLSAAKDNVSFHEVGWQLSSPDNSARLLWGDGIIIMEMDAKPFLDAGLDVTEIPYDFFDDKIMIYEELWFAAPSPGDTPLAAYEQIVNRRRDIIGYHADMDHYGISIKEGNVFEWAKNLNTNDKDIVFVLNPQPFMDSGVDINNIEGWVFGKVKVEDERGRMIEVDKLLKPFNLL